MLAASSFFLVFGGRVFGSSPQFLNDIWMFDAERGWQRPNIAGQAPSPRSSCSACELSPGLFVIYGGYDRKGPLNDMFLLEVRADQSLEWTCVWDPKSIVPNDDKCCRPLVGPQASYAQCIFPLAGAIHVLSDELKEEDIDSGQGTGFYSVLWKFHMRFKSWSKCTSLAGRPAHVPVSQGASIVHRKSNRLVLFGGYNGQRCLDRIWVLQAETENEDSKESME